MRTLPALALMLPALALADPRQPQPLQTPDTAGQSSAGIAAAAPMHDMNLMSQKIPPLLMAVMADPYARPASMDCGALASQVNALNEALGDDFDAVVDEDNSKQARRARTAREGLHAGSEALLPFSGFVRKLSGAEQHDKLVIDAIMSGDARRAYLKGLGEARGCGGPATPVHLTHDFDQPTEFERSASR
jgi:hypothetical protein